MDQAAYQLRLKLSRATGLSSSHSPSARVSLHFHIVPISVVFPPPPDPVRPFSLARETVTENWYGISYATWVCSTERAFSTFSRDHTEGLQSHVVAPERLLEVHGQLVAIAIGRAAIQPAGIRAAAEQAASTCRRTCRALAIVRHSRRHMGIHFKVRRSTTSP